ncbi:MAG: lipid A deacylase LpxR family protein [Rubrimonas sp.]|uniref:lipid A deacylase LpxR family protein n=1 Tax=Rubrimonas sp. TaxID=2036015 RepID=UPI002FDD5213
MRRAALLLPLLAACPALAEDDAPPRGTLSLIWENDIFAGEDRKYTNGAFLRYTAPEGELHLWARGLRDALDGFVPQARWGMSYGLGHSMFTSSDINDPDPPLEDRPYAGFLYGTAALYADSGDRLDALALDLGIVGPSAKAEEIQRWVHDNILGDEPQGWDTQLGDEIAFRVLYEQTRRHALADDALGMGFEADILPRASVALGTLDVSAGAGAMVRIGENLRADYGPDRVRRSVSGPAFADDQGGWQLFAAADAMLVGRNLFLDGNTFRDSRSVDTNPAFVEFSLGGAYRWENVSLSYAHVLRSPEFDTQDDWAVFGSVNLRFRF